MPDFARHHRRPLSAAQTPETIRTARHVSAVTIAAVIAVAAAAVTLAACIPLQPQPPHPATAQPNHGAPRGTAAPIAGDTLLPVSPAALAAVADLASQFAAAYASYRYDESPRSYLARLRPMAAASLYSTLATAAQAPGLQAQRSAERLVARATARPESVRDIQASAVIVVVRVSQDIASTAGQSESAAAYAVTVTTQNGQWQVYDIEPAAAGDQGGATG